MQISSNKSIHLFDAGGTKPAATDHPGWGLCCFDKYVGTIRHSSMLRAICRRKKGISSCENHIGISWMIKKQNAHTKAPQSTQFCCCGTCNTRRELYWCACIQQHTQSPRSHPHISLSRCQCQKTWIVFNENPPWCSSNFFILHFKSSQ